MKSKKYKPISILILILIGINQTIFSQDLIKSIPIEGRNLTNLSGAVNDSISFHIVINKISTGYNSKIYFLDKNNEINNLEIYNEVNKPNYLTFHVNDSTLTIVRESTNKKIIVQDINYINRKITFSKIPFEAKQIFSHKNITFIVGQKTNVSYPFAFIKKASNTVAKIITPKTQLDKSFFSSLRKKSEFVNDKQFLANGPILDYKGFYNGEELVFTNEDKKKGVTNILTIKPSGKIINRKIQVRNKNELKRLSSFVKDSLLFTFKMYQEESFFDIYALNSLEKLKTFHYTKSEFGKHNKIVMRGKDITKSFKPKKVYNDFTPQAIGSMYLPALNISVNKTIDNEYLVRIGHLDQNSYNNKTTNNFWWNNNAYALNYNLNSGAFSINGTGAQMMIFKALADAKNTGNYFEVNLNSSLEKIDSDNAYKYYDIDENIYNNRLKNIMNLERHFYIIQKDNIRLINYDKKLKTYNIYNLTKINE
ncbi:hypothetical protein [Polaribacter sargassicola]|uniref:hypothetical protein n=1 Tax=Polaribacter sargassicola TaxID=2836891 RepID=UPI001F1C6A20|nr:hypothetical protein [Polaribacter sp. DS7-9]MCG1037745.1 hypothetical protein [Polaribacter sp. DS7-9]